jgi:hypothetical protein
VSYGRRRGFEPIAIVGLIVTALLHGGAIGGILLYRRALAAAQVPPPLPSYVVAKLLRLGKPKDPKKLPDKIVPQEATKKDEGIDLSADAGDAPARKKKKDDDPDAKLSNKMRRSLDKADLLAAAQREIEGEGSPDGVRHGTATKAQGGDPYLTKLADLFNRTWALPAIIPAGEARKLHLLMVLKIDREGNIQTPIQVDRSSGNVHFDSSVTAAWQRIKRVPIPPPDRFASMLANGLGLKITWKGMQ